MSKCVCFCACVCVHVSECVLNQTERLNMNVQFLISIDMRRNGFKRERFYRDENLHIFRFCYLITTATDLFVFFPMYTISNFHFCLYGTTFVWKESFSQCCLQYVRFVFREKSHVWVSFLT